jgi:hypothetical protein
VTSNIGLGPPSSSEPLIDISSGPLFRFLLCEKFHQPHPPLPYFLQSKVQMDAEKHITAAANPMSDSGSVDVVLISEQQEGMGAVQDSLRVGAHHVCHCRYATLLPV